MKELPKAYNPQDFEDKIYKSWEEKQLFNPDTVKNDGDPFCIVLPPPNVTGTLHLGHASMLAIEDLMIRYKKMQGFDTLWVPGTDHAAIATQNVVEKRLAKENKTRHDLGREKFLGKIDEFVQESKDTIHRQVRKMGAALDWSREAYTLDETRSKAVRKVFKMMFDDGLIYRGYRIVNWCPRCKSTLSDDEVIYREEKNPFYYFKYGPVTIGTARPETKFGDKVIIVHPDDKRYKDLVGKEMELEWILGPIKAKVIADEAAEMEMGSGAMTITPAHSFVDFDLAKKYDLKIEKIINEDGKLTSAAGEFAGMDVKEAREKVVEILTKKGLVEKVDEDYVHNLSVCYRCKTPIEPLPSKQWFVDVNKKTERLGNLSLKEKSLEVVKDGSVKFIPERFEKTYYNWMENLHDWCISRQIWFGHQVPVWYCGDQINSNEDLTVETAAKDGCGSIMVGEVEPRECKCGSHNIVQDEDTLDTWFSSGLWTFTTLLDKDFTDFDKANNPDLKRFHPTAVLETGYDIIFFWVARMILMTTYVTGEIPFEKVYMHGLIRDRDGQKMSKSRPETAIDPIVVGDKYGYDAVRLSLLIGGTPGNDLRLYDEKIAGYRNFVNKLWNVSRFILMSLEKDTFEHGEVKAQTLADEWILSRFTKMHKSVTKNLDEYNFSAAGQELYDFTWNELADWYLEISKVEQGKDDILIHILKDLLKMWHPFTPFVTEALWSYLDQDKEIMISNWPVLDQKMINDSAEVDFEKIRVIVGKIRNIRAEYKVSPGKKVDVQFKAKDQALLESQSEIIKGLARLENISFVDSKPEQAASAVVEDIEIYLPLEGLVDVAQEKDRLQKEIDNLSGYITGVEKKLSNKEFADNAPKTVVDGEKAKMEEAQAKLEKLQTQLSSL